MVCKDSQEFIFGCDRVVKDFFCLEKYYFNVVYEENCDMFDEEGQ